MAAPVARSVTTALSIDARGWVAGNLAAQRSSQQTARVAQQGAREAIRAFREQQVAQERASAAAERAAQRAAREQTRSAQQAARAAQQAARQQEQATKRAAAEAERAAAKQADAYDKVGTAVGAAGLAITAGLGFAISKSMDFEAAMSGAAAATGLSGKALDALQATAVRAGASTQYSATEAADAITAMAKAGISAQDIMGGGLTGALNLAAAGQLAVADAAEIAASMMTQFRLEGSELPHVADLLAASAGKAQGSVQDMGLAMTYVGPVAAGLGVSIEETAGAVGLLASNGIIGEKAGTGLRGVLMSLTGPSEKAAGVMEDLGINLYDATGNFVGVRGAADQLHRALGPLTNAQRDQALATLFGNEQIVAARIFYEGGGRAVDEWTAKVNDAGFAADQAAKLTDNLRGDLERLGGAFDTALIGSGSDANGILRETVQLGTGALDIYNNLPGAVQTTGTAFAAAAGGAGLLAGGLLLAAPRIKATKDALNDMGRVGSTLQRGLSGTAGILGGPWGIALAAGTTALGFWAQKHADAVKWQQDLRGTLDQTTGAITDQTTAMVAQRLQEDDTFSTFGRLAGSLEQITQAAMGNAGALEDLRARQAAVRTELEGLVNANRILTPEESARMQGLGEQIQAYDALFGRLGTVRGELGEQIGKQKELAAATGTSTEKSDAAGVAAQGLADATGQAAGAAATAEDRISALNDALQAVYDSALATEGSADAFHASLNRLSDAVSRNGTRLKGNSEAALGNREAFRNATQAAIRHLQTMVENGAGTDQVSRKARAYKEELLRQATRLGLTRKDVERYTGALDQVPGAVETQVRTPGMDPAKEKVAALLRSVQELDKINAVTVRVGVLNKIKANNDAMTGGDGYGDSSQPVARRWSGGQVFGPGGPRDDQIPALLSNREWVHPVNSVDLYGPRFMRAVQTGAFPVELAQAFADGGQVRTPVELRGTADLAESASTMRDVVKSLESMSATAGGGGIGGRAGAGAGMGYQKQMAILRGQFPGLQLISGFRPGAITATGNRSYHGMGRAVDIPPRMDVFEWLRANYGRSTKELIFSPANNRQVWNGRPHYYSGITRRNHFDHVHWAMNAGGQVLSGRGARQPASRYSGGWAKARGYAAGGQVLGADYSGISSIVSARVTVSRDDVTRANDEVKTANKAVRESAADLAKANKELAQANRELARAKKDERKSAREAVARAREDRDNAAKDLREDRATATRARATAGQTSRDFRTQTRPLATRFHEAATTRNRVTAGFLRNLQTLASRGFGNLARQLAEMGGAEAETLAGQAVASTRTARTLQADLTTSARLQAQADTLPAQLAITSALRTQRNPTIAGLARSTGIAASDLQAAALSMRGSLGRNSNARALLSGLGTNTTVAGVGANTTGGDQIVVQVASTGNPWLDGERALAGAKRVKAVGSSRRF